MKEPRININQMREQTILAAYEWREEKSLGLI